MQENYSKESFLKKYPYKHIKTFRTTNRFGQAIYSKYPIINSGAFNFKNTSNNIIYADIIIKKDTIRVYNFHLQSLQINPSKEHFGEQNSEKLIARLKKGFIKQASQTEKFLTHQKKWKGRTILCGDFNNTAYSWVYHQIAKDKKDAFIEAGKGFGKTFNYGFPMRIDFILTDNDMAINKFDTFSKKYSDHYPIMARITI